MVESKHPRLALGIFLVALLLGTACLLAAWRSMEFLAHGRYLAAIVGLGASLGLGHATSKVVEALLAERLQ